MTERQRRIEAIESEIRLTNRELIEVDQVLFKVRLKLEAHPDDLALIRELQVAQQWKFQMKKKLAYSKSELMKLQWKERHDTRGTYPSPSGGA